MMILPNVLRPFRDRFGSRKLQLPLYLIALSVTRVFTLLSTRLFTLSNSSSAFVWNTGSYWSSGFVLYVVVFSWDEGCPRLEQVERWFGIIHIDGRSYMLREIDGLLRPPNPTPNRGGDIHTS